MPVYLHVLKIPNIQTYTHLSNVILYIHILVHNCIYQKINKTWPNLNIYITIYKISGIIIC